MYMETAINSDELNSFLVLLKLNNGFSFFIETAIASVESRTQQISIFVNENLFINILNKLEFMLKVNSKVISRFG